MRISRGKSEGIKFLTEEERDRVEALELYGMTEKVRDMFIFSCYTGLAYSDLVKIKKSDVFRQGEDYCIRDKRMKTGMPYTIVLLPKAIAILKKYNYNLNLMSNQKCNDQLKIIANLASLHINLTMHVGRHTFATWALTKKNMTAFMGPMNNRLERLEKRIDEQAKEIERLRSELSAKEKAPLTVTI